MKYKIGDEFYKIEKICYLANPYHYKIIFSGFNTVKSANSHFFSEYDVDLTKDISGMDGFKFHRQISGRDFHGGNPVLHIVQDRAQIESLVKAQIDKDLTDANGEAKNEIGRLLSQIENIKSRIEDIKKSGVKTCDGKHYKISFIKDNADNLLSLIAKKQPNQSE